MIYSHILHDTQLYVCVCVTANNILHVLVFCDMMSMYHVTRNNSTSLPYKGSHMPVVMRPWLFIKMSVMRDLPPTSLEGNSFLCGQFVFPGKTTTKKHRLISDSGGH